MVCRPPVPLPCSSSSLLAQPPTRLPAREAGQNRAGEAVCATRLPSPPPATRDASSVKPMRGEEEATKTSDDDLGHTTATYTDAGQFSRGFSRQGTPADSAPHGPRATDYVDRRSSVLQQAILHRTDAGTTGEELASGSGQGKGWRASRARRLTRCAFKSPPVDSQMLTARPVTPFRWSRTSPLASAALASSPIPGRLCVAGMVWPVARDTERGTDSVDSAPVSNPILAQLRLRCTGQVVLPKKRVRTSPAFPVARRCIFIKETITW